MRTASGRANHAIPLAQALYLPPVEVPVDPYVLGAWLGDGSSNGGRFTGIDAEIWEEIERAGFRISHHKDAKSHSILGFDGFLRALGVLNNKHVPLVYLRGSRSQRLALLQGLMDTDGTVCDLGAVEFTNMNKRLADAAYELIVSLGWKARLVEGRATLDDRDCGPKYDIKWTPDDYVFRLSRKRDKQKLASRRTTQFRYIVGCDPIAPIPMRCIAVDSPSHLYLAGRSMIPTHNSDALLMAALQYADVPGYHALIVRRNIPDLAMPNALMDRAHAWLRRRNDARWDESKKRWSFASGATLTFGYLDAARDIDRYASAEFEFIGVDELTQFQEKQYLDLFARLRAPACIRCGLERDYIQHRESVHPRQAHYCPICVDLERRRLSVVHLAAAHIPLRMRAASNPGNIGHDWVKRRFVSRLGAPAGERLFVPARLNDNPFINREEYVISLMNLDPVTRDRILKGDWEARSTRGVLKREWFQIVDAPPAELEIVRYWDTAYQKTKTSDFTAGVKYGIARNGVGYLLHVARMQGTPHEVESFIANIAGQDSRNIRVVLQQEPGSGSALWIDAMRRGLLLGYPVYADQVRGTKFERSQPFRAAAEAGNLKLLRGAWNEALLEECEQFSPNEREYAHDDQVDAACGAFNYITAPEPFRYIPLPKRGSVEWDDLPRVTTGGRFSRIKGCW